MGVRMSITPESAKHRARRTPRKPASALAEKWTTIDGVDVFYRESPHPPTDPRVMAHIHGFGLSGRYLLPTAERLADEFHTYVPDLPGFGRSGKKRDMLDIPDLAHAAADFLDDRGVEKASLVGNSMGCPVIIEFAHHYPERIDRAILVSPAGGLFNQPLRRAIGQLSRDAPREPTRMARVAVPDYVRFGVPSTMALFKALTQYPSLNRLLEMKIPTLVVLGERDPLLPGLTASARSRVRPTVTCSWSFSRAPPTPSTSVTPTSSRTSSGCSWRTARW